MSGEWVLRGNWKEGTTWDFLSSGLKVITDRRDGNTSFISKVAFQKFLLKLYYFCRWRVRAYFSFSKNILILKGLELGNMEWIQRKKLMRAMKSLVSNASQCLLFLPTKESFETPYCTFFYYSSETWDMYFLFCQITLRTESESSGSFIAFACPLRVKTKELGLTALLLIEFLVETLKINSEPYSKFIIHN